MGSAPSDHNFSGNHHLEFSIAVSGFSQPFARRIALMAITKATLFQRGFQ